MYPSASDTLFLNLIKQNKITIDPKQHIVEIDGIIKTPKICKIKKREYLGITYRGKLIFMPRLIYMYLNKDYIPQNYYAVPKDGNIFNYNFDNIKIIEQRSKILELMETGRIVSRGSSAMKTLALTNNNQCKLTLKEVERYRCLYHQKKITRQEIEAETGMKYKSVANFLKFRTYSFDPITGEYDETLKNIYCNKEDIYKEYTKRSRTTVTNKIDKINKVDIETPKKKVIKTNSNNHKSNLFKGKIFTLPLSFDDAYDIYSLYKNKKITYSDISNDINIPVNIIKQYFSMLRFFINIYPNYILMDCGIRNNKFTNFINKYQIHFEVSLVPNIKPYSFKYVLGDIDIETLRELHEKYKNNCSIEELSEVYEIDAIKVKMGIIEYDRYCRLYSEERLTPEQFNVVYS